MIFHINFPLYDHIYCDLLKFASYWYFFTPGSEAAVPVGAEPDGEDGVPEHPQGAVQRRRAQAGLPDRAQDAVRGPSLPTRLLVQES